MRNALKCSVIFVALMTVCACASQPPAQLESVRPPEWSYESNAIHIHLKADSRLNLYQNLPHTLLMCVYQLSDPNGFNQLAEDKTGLYKLLECQRFDQSVTNAKRLVIQPGQDETFHMDRAEGTRYVGIAAGYYTLDKTNIVKLYQLVLAERKEPGGVRVSKPAPLNIDLYLAPQSLQPMGGK